MTTPELTTRSRISSSEMSSLFSPPRTMTPVSELDIVPYEGVRRPWAGTFDAIGVAKLGSEVSERGGKLLLTGAADEERAMPDETGLTAAGLASGRGVDAEAGKLIDELGERGIFFPGARHDGLRFALQVIGAAGGFDHGGLPCLCTAKDLHAPLIRSRDLLEHGLDAFPAGGDVLLKRIVSEKNGTEAGGKDLGIGGEVGDGALMA